MGNWFSLPLLDFQIFDTDGGAAPVVTNTVDCVVNLIRKHAPHVAVVTGAGISSHQLPTFRSTNNTGLWDAFSPGRIDEGGFRKSWGLLATIRHLQKTHTLHPSLAHHVLHQMLSHDLISHMVTQNIDRLHCFASDVNKVVELHGAVSDFGFCQSCAALRPVDILEIVKGKQAPVCTACGSSLRPRVAFFGDAVDPPERSRARDAIRDASLLLIVGTHMTVDPVAAMVRAAKEGYAVVVEINLRRTAASNWADVSLAGTADDILGEIGRRLMPDVNWDALDIEKWRPAPGTMG
jgi:NAD-dependent deacetylase